MKANTGFIHAVFGSVLLGFTLLLLPGCPLDQLNLPVPFQIETRLLSASDAQAEDRYGISVAVSGAYALVGAVQEDGGSGNPAANCGAVYAYERGAGGVWLETQVLRMSDRQTNDEFGCAITISGSYAAMGARNECGGSGDPFSRCGAVYVFERNLGGTWEEKQILYASDRQANDRFGCSVSLSGDYLIVGAYSEDGGPGDPFSMGGAAYIFERNASGVWEEKQILHSSDEQADDQFGNAVAVSGAYAVVGAYWESGGPGDPVTRAGSAYVFERRTDGVWEEKQILRAADREPWDYFAGVLAIDGSCIIVGASGEQGGPGGGYFNGGAAYVFERNGAGNWEEKAELHAAQREAGASFGWSVAVSGTRAVVGAADETDAGAAHLFQREADGTWQETSLLHASDRWTSDEFGISVSISGSYILVGADGKDELNGSTGTDFGVVYIFE